MGNFNRFLPVLNWDFVKADPVTYRTIDGEICFEVTLETNNPRGAITVTRTEGDKSAIKVFRNRRKALIWCEKRAVDRR
jgi:hypothetical protein